MEEFESFESEQTMSEFDGTDGFGEIPEEIIEDKTYTITLADETKIENLKLNGNCFISNIEIDMAVFEGNCSPVIINDGEHDEFHENMEAIQAASVDDRFWFALRDISTAELEKIKTQSDIEYLAMMVGVEM